MLGTAAGFSLGWFAWLISDRVGGESTPPFWPFARWPLRWTRFDVLANVIAYAPFGLFIAVPSSMRERIWYELRA